MSSSAGSGPPAAAVPDPAIGSRVVVDPDPKCGACDSCRAGRPANCENIVALGVHRDGALARFVTAPANSVYPISEDVPAELAALVEPLACVVNGTNLAAIRPGEPVVVFGAGAIGCLFIAVFKASGAGRIVAVEPSRPARAGRPGRWRRRGLHPGGMGGATAESCPAARVVVDAVGSVLPQAIDAAAMGARVILFGMNGNARPAGPPGRNRGEGPVHPWFVHQQLHLPGGDPADRGRSAQPWRPMISAIVPLEDTAAGIARLRSGKPSRS